MSIFEKRHKHKWEWRKCSFPYVRYRAWSAYCKGCATVIPVPETECGWDVTMTPEPEIPAQAYIGKPT